MKKLLSFAALGLMFFLISVDVSAQGYGRWISYQDPYSGQMRQCWQAYEGAVCQSYPAPQQIYSTPAQSPSQYSVPYSTAYPNGYPQYPAAYPSGYPNGYPTVYEPVPAAQRQHRKYKRHDWDVGYNGYTRLPTVRYSRTSETETIVVETTDSSYYPQIYVNSYGNRYYQQYYQQYYRRYSRPYNRPYYRQYYRP